MTNKSEFDLRHCICGTSAQVIDRIEELLDLEALVSEEDLPEDYYRASAVRRVLAKVRAES